MATREEIYAAIRNADKAGDAQAVQKLGAYLATLDAGHAAAASKVENDAISQGARDPTAGMNGAEKFIAGYGGAIPGVLRGVGQALGLVSQEDVDAAKRRDAPLMASGAGMAGNIAGNVAAFIPTVAIPGANTVTGAAAIGAGMGALQPVASGDSRLKNTLIGGVAGGGGVVAGRALAGAAQGAKALVEPFTQGGRDKIAGRVIQRFADDPATVVAARGGLSPTGALPTIAEETGDAGMARLQDAARSMDPQIAKRIDARLVQNNAARIGQLRDMAGKDGARDFAAEMRSGTAKDLYDRAFSVAIEPENLSPAMRGEVTKLLKMPAIQNAMKDARLNAQNHGMKLDNMDASIAGLHQTKLAMDDAISALKDGTAAQANKAAGIEAARDRLVSFMEKMSPDYRDARLTYAEMSKPLNQMDVAAGVLKSGASPTKNLAGDEQLYPSALTKLVQDDGEALVKKATGRKGLGGLSKVLAPEQKKMLDAIVSEVDRTGAVARAGNGPGSATAQRMAAQNILRQLVGPTGLPQSWAESVLANTLIGKPFNLLYGGVAEPKIQQALAEAVLNPQAAQRLLKAAQGNPRLPQNQLARILLEGGGQAARLTPPAVAVNR